MTAIIINGGDSNGDDIPRTAATAEAGLIPMNNNMRA